MPLISSRGLRTEYERPQAPVVLNGVIVRAADGYQGGRITADERRTIHSRPGRRLCRQPSRHDHGSHDDEYAGGDRGRPGRQGPDSPCAISFTVETDGRLVTGRSLQHAIETVDAETGGYPHYY